MLAYPCRSNCRPCCHFVRFDGTVAASGRSDNFGAETQHDENVCKLEGRCSPPIGSARVAAFVVLGVMTEEPDRQTSSPRAKVAAHRSLRQFLPTGGNGAVNPQIVERFQSEYLP